VGRHYRGMKTVLCLSLFFAACAFADETADRAAIGRAIAALNEQPSRIAEIAESRAAARELDVLQFSGRPRVTISHEPWGEATIDYSATEVVRYKIVSGAVRFLTPEVALVDGAMTRQDGTFLYRPILFVMKKVGDGWKIASARMLALH